MSSVLVTMIRARMIDSPVCPLSRRAKYQYLPQCTRASLRRTDTRPFLLRAVAVLMLALTASCATISNMMPAQKKAHEHAARLQELQIKVMRFADEYAGRLYDPINRMLNGPLTPEERLAVHSWRLSQASSAYTIASGPNSITNALDMVVLATLSRMVVEDTWETELYGERANELRDVHRRLEPEAWDLVREVLTPEQVQQLHTVIDEWRAQNPRVRAVAYIHLQDFARSIGRPKSSQDGSANLFAMLGLDPLSNLDPAVQEIAQTRQLAERTIYYVQRAPDLLDMQVERLTFQLATMPEMKQLLADTNRVSLAAASAGALAGDLPQIVANERKAAIDQFMSALNSEQARARQLLSELRGTLAAGTQTSDSVNATIRSLDSMLARFDKPAPNPETQPAGRPFDITEYTATARELAAAAQQLQLLLAQLDSSTAAVERLSASATTSLSAVVDHAFWRGVQLILVLVGAVLLAMIAWHFVTRPRAEP
jgi:methyl-accepting chemotaxis protein